jgi:hypothetical protein
MWGPASVSFEHSNILRLHKRQTFPSLVEQHHLIERNFAPCISVYTTIFITSVSGYALDNRAIGVRSPAEGKGFSSSSNSGAHPAPVQWVPEVLSPGVKRGRGVTLTTHSHLVPRSRMSRSYTSSPPQAPSWRVAGLLYPFLPQHFMCSD